MITKDWYRRELKMERCEFVEHKAIMELLIFCEIAALRDFC